MFLGAEYVLPLMGIFLLGAVVRELRLIRLRLGGHVGFLPWKED